jgi:hypothetical protein
VSPLKITIPSKNICEKPTNTPITVQAGKQKEVHPPYSPDLAPAGARSGEYGGLLSVSPPEEHHERRTFC